MNNNILTLNQMAGLLNDIPFLIPKRLLVFSIKLISSIREIIKQLSIFQILVKI